MHLILMKTCEIKLSYILAVVYNMCLKESRFPDRWKVSSVVSLFMNVGEWSMAKIFPPVGLLSVVSKIFEKLIIATSRNANLCLISRMVSGFLDQL